MQKDFGYLGESKTAIAFTCPECTLTHIINKDKVLNNETNEIILKNDFHCGCDFTSKLIDKDYINNTIAKRKNISKNAGLLAIIFFAISILTALTVGEYPTEFQSVLGGYSLYLSIPSLIICFIFASENTPAIQTLKIRYLSVLSEHLQKDKTELHNLLTQKLNEAKIPQDCATITLKKQSHNILSGTYYIWKNNELLCLFPLIQQGSSLDLFAKDIEKANKVNLPMSSIEYFATQGEIYRENKISGGGGGGSSVGGAVVGAVIAGEAGAIIGSRKKVEEIKSETITHDTREAFINYFDDDKKRMSMFLIFNDFQTLNDIIPEKNYSVVSALKTSTVINKIKENNIKSVTGKIRELSSLKDDGIITEDEFSEKKKELLAKM